MRGDRDGVEVFANPRLDLREISAKPWILKTHALRGHRAGFGLRNQSVESVELIDQPDELRTLTLRIRDGDVSRANRNRKDEENVACNTAGMVQRSAPTDEGR